MPRLAFLLRPGWLALALVVVAFTYLCFTVLAPWQLGKNAKTSRENQQIRYSLDTPPVPLKTLLPQQDSSANPAGRAVAPGDGNRTVPSGRAGAGPTARGGGGPGV